MIDGVPQHFRDQGAWVSRDRKCRGLARLRVRGVGRQVKRRGSLGGRISLHVGSHTRDESEQTGDGALSYAALAAGNSDDLFHIRNAALGRKAATRHYWGFTLLRESLRETN